MKKECYIPVESIGVIMRDDKKNMVGIANRDGSCDYAPALSPISKAKTLREKLTGVKSYEQALAIIKTNNP